jgi:cytochrome c oxidase subunit 2
MARNSRPRRLASAALTAGLALAIVTLAACTTDKYPNSTFHHTTEFNEAIDHIWDRLMFWGTIVFVLVEAMIVYVVIRFRQREGQPEPRHVHGNTTLEITWTAIPAVILVFIAIPTVRTIFRTQAKAVPSALQVEVIGHQWWWEFRYPQYTTRGPTGKLDTLTTANELYLPVGRTANFALKTADVLHSFWIPRLGGKRDLISNHTNYIWFTPKDSMAMKALNGSCNEYCGASHANMRFRTFTVTPAQFESWAKHQATPAAFNAAPTPPPPPPAAAPRPGAASTGAATTGVTTAGATVPARTVVQSAGTVVQGGVPVDSATGPGAAGRSKPTQGTMAQTAGAQSAAGASPGFVFPRESLPDYFIPQIPMPKAVNFPAGLKGDPARGQKIYSSSACIACHYINGNPMSVGRVGPNLTHVGTRYTLAGAQYPNTPEYMARWIKNARALKPGSLMPTLGQNETDPITKQRVTVGGLTDQQIADIVAYLEALK